MSAGFYLNFLDSCAGPNVRKRRTAEKDACDPAVRCCPISSIAQRRPHRLSWVEIRAFADGRGRGWTDPAIRVSAERALAAS
jgi:hypothetical protein